MGRIRMKQERMEQRGIDGARNGKNSVREPLMGQLCYRGVKAKASEEKERSTSGQRSAP